MSDLFENLQRTATDETRPATDRIAAYRALAGWEGDRPAGLEQPVVYWLGMAKLGSTEGYLNYGLYNAQKYFAGQNATQKGQYLTQALAAFKPLADPAYEMPQASLYIGLLMQDAARIEFGEPDLTPSNDAKTAHALNLSPDARAIYLRAAQQYEVAAGIKDRDGQKYPQTAANALAVLYRWGLGPMQDTAKAVTLFQQAADGGFAEAQVNLAGMLVRGEGVAQDVGKAIEWLMKAQPQMTAGHPALAEWNGLINTITQIAAAPEPEPEPGRPKGPAVPGPTGPVAG